MLCLCFKAKEAKMDDFFADNTSNLAKALNESKDARQVDNYFRSKAKHDKRSNKKSNNIEREVNCRKASRWLRNKLSTQCPELLAKLDLLDQELIWTSAVQQARSCRRTPRELMEFIQEQLEKTTLHGLGMSYYKKEKKDKTVANDSDIEVLEMKKNKSESARINSNSNTRTKSESGSKRVLTRKQARKEREELNLKSISRADCSALSKKYTSRWAPASPKRSKLCEDEVSLYMQDDDEEEEEQFDSGDEFFIKDDDEYENEEEIIQELKDEIIELKVMVQSLVTVVDEMRKKVSQISQDLSVIESRQPLLATMDDLYSVEQDVKDFMTQTRRAIKAADLKSNLLLPPLNMNYGQVEGAQSNQNK